MPARDLYHDNLKTALIKDGWTITHDPLPLKYGKRTLLVDLGAERLITAEKGGRKIAVEGKSFVGESEMEDLEQALGQFILYHDVLAKADPDRILFLAIRQSVWSTLFAEPIGQLLLANQRVRLLVYDHGKEEVLQWLP